MFWPLLKWEIIIIIQWSALTSILILSQDFCNLNNHDEDTRLSIAYNYNSSFQKSKLKFNTLKIKYIFSQPGHHEQDVTQGQFLSEVTVGLNRDIGPAVRVFANRPGDLGSIPGRVIPKTLKMVLDTTLLNTQHYKVRFKGKVEQSWEWSSALPYTLV